jgi:hypothetical protein
LILTDIAQIIYAPHKVFKKIVANPKYLAAIIVLILFIGLQMGYEYAQLSKTNVEVTSPQPGLFSNYTNASSGNWRGTSGVNFTNNLDYMNYTLFVSNYGYYPSVFGNTSLQFTAQNTQNVSAALGSTFNVDCSANGFQNLSMIVKLVEPQNASPQTAKLTLYTLGEVGSYQYDLTSQLSNASLIGQWNNITIPIGPNAQGWTPSGNPTWNNMTSLKLDLTYPTAENVTVRISALFFRGQYMSLAENDPTTIIFSSLQSVSLQFLVMWLLVAAIMYLILKGLKMEITWKPLFVAVGAALIIIVIRAALNLALTLALPPVYYPFDLSTGLNFASYGVIAYPQLALTTLSADSLAAFYSIETATATFRAASLFLFGATFVWLGIVCTFIAGALKPELTLPKKILASAVAITITLLVLIYLLLGYA